MIYAGPASQGWPGWALRRTWQTKSLITSPARSLALRRFINGTSFWRSVGRHSICGELMSINCSQNDRASSLGALHDAPCNASHKSADVDRRG